MKNSGVPKFQGGIQFVSSNILQPVVGHSILRRKEEDEDPISSISSDEEALPHESSLSKVERVNLMAMPVKDLVRIEGDVSFNGGDEDIEMTD